jgi:hypothetical protein
MTPEGWTVPLDNRGSWLCEHTDKTGQPAPASRLWAWRARPERKDWRSRRAQNARSWLRCPDCGTHWRVWKRLKVAKYYVADPRAFSAVPDPAAPVPRYRRAKVWDIDRIVEGVREVIPDLLVMQHAYVWPADDDGIWWLKLPEITKSIQLENGYGCCPFLVETEEQSSYEARTGGSVEEAAAMVVEYLRPLS